MQTVVEARAGDPTAVLCVLEHVRPWVGPVVRRWAGRDRVLLEDLRQESVLAVMGALQGWRPDGGSSFRSYAKVCLSSRLRDVVRRYWFPVSVPRRFVRMLCAARAAADARHACGLPSAPTLEEAQAWPGGARAVAEASAPDWEASAGWERRRAHELLAPLLAGLDQRSRFVLGAWASGWTYARIARAIGRHPARVHQLRTLALASLRRRLGIHG